MAVTNPLIDLKLSWWENYIPSQLLGADWRVSLWNKFTTALDGYVSTSAQTVSQFVTSHVDAFISSIAGSNFLLALTLEGVLNKVLPVLISAGEAYVEENVTPSPTLA